MSEYGEGVKTGYATASGGNPFAVMMKRVDEARARKSADEKDLRELKNLFLELGKKHEYQKSLEEEKGKQDRMTELFKGISSGEIEVDDETAEGVLSQFGMGRKKQGTSGIQGQGINIPVSQEETLRPSVASLPESFGFRQNPNSPSEMKKKKAALDLAKAEFEAGERDRLQENKSQMVLDTAQDTLNTIAEVEKGINHFGTFGNVPSIPGTARRTWESNVDKLLSDKVLNTIRTMKETSKTGATGFGQLNLKELEVLQKASTALKKDLPKADAQKYINEIKAAMNKIIESKGMEEDPRGEKPEDDFSNMSDEELKAIINGR